MTVFDVGEHLGRPLIVMEYVEGGSVYDRLRSGRVQLDEALRWLEQAAAALDRAHASGVVHRDVKPANLLLDRDGNVHVSDFGIASATGADTLTAAGTVLGTAGYLSPEQARGEPATAASDRYALGVVAFELITGRRPFAGDTPTTEAFAHLHAEVPSATAVDPTLPSGVDAVFQHALAKDPDRRPASARALVAELRASLESSADAPAPTLVGPGEPTRQIVYKSAPPARLDRGSSRDSAPRSRVRRGRGADRRRRRERDAQDAVARDDDHDVRLRCDGDVCRTRGRRRSSRRQGFALLQAGDYAGALPLLRAAVVALKGSGVLTEAYASYNLAFARFANRRCDGVIGLLDRSERIQGDGKRSTSCGGSGRLAAPPAAGLTTRVTDGPGRARGKARTTRASRVACSRLRLGCEEPDDLAVLGEASLVLLRVDGPSVDDDVELRPRAGCGRRVDAELSCDLGRETRGPCVVPASGGAVEDLDDHGSTAYPGSRCDRAAKRPASGIHASHDCTRRSWLS